jgi:hypothetical protein
MVIVAAEPRGVQAIRNDLSEALTLPRGQTWVQQITNAL